MFFSALTGGYTKTTTSAARSDKRITLSAEDLGILLQWHWKYGTSTFANGHQRVQLSQLMLFSAFTSSQPDTLLREDDSPSKNSQESSIDDSSNSTLADNLKVTRDATDIKLHKTVGLALMLPFGFLSVHRHRHTTENHF